MGHFVTLGPVTFPNLNISTIWVRDPWVSIQINFWVSLPPTKEVLHTCKIVNYFKLPIDFWWGGKLLGEGVVERGKGLGERRVWEGGWGKGVGQGVGARGCNLYLNEF